MKKLVLLSLFFILVSGFAMAQTQSPQTQDQTSQQGNAQSAAAPDASASPAASPAASPDATVSTSPAPSATPAPSPTPAASPAPTTTASTPTPDSFTFESDHYTVRSYVSTADAQSAAERLEAYLSEYNKYFHFDLNKLGLKLKVRVFATKSRFDQYLQRLISETRDDYVYLHYSDAARSELVGYEDPKGDAPAASIAHQGFIQFLRAFIPNPPLWLREGFAVYFESLSYDSNAKTATLLENTAWLETLKDLVLGSKTADAIPVSDLLTYSVDQARDKISVFYPEAWGLVSFLINSPDKMDNRIIWDSIALLSPSASLDDNSSALVAGAFSWEDSAQLNTDFQSYLQNKKTYRELIQDGIDDYAAGKAKDAETAFDDALNLRDDSYVPYYYLGLLNYDKASYGDAETFYKKALDKGADAALTNYALGVNAFADNRFDAATDYLKKTATLDPSFQDKVNDLLQRIES